MANCFLVFGWLLPSFGAKTKCCTIYLIRLVICGWLHETKGHSRKNEQPAIYKQMNQVLCPNLYPPKHLTGHVAHFSTAKDPSFSFKILGWHLLQFLMVEITKFYHLAKFTHPAFLICTHVDNETYVSYVYPSPGLKSTRVHLNHLSNSSFAPLTTKHVRQIRMYRPDNKAFIVIDPDGHIKSVISQISDRWASTHPKHLTSLDSVPTTNYV